MANAKIDWNDVARLCDPKADIPQDQIDREVAAIVKAADKADGRKVLATSLAVHRGYEITHTLGNGDGQTGRNAYAQRIGVSPAYITKVRRLGRALAGGVEYADKDGFWSDLSKHVNAKPVGAILDARDEETDTLLPLDVDALREAVTAQGAKAKTSGAKGGAAGSGPADPADAPPVEKGSPNELAVTAMRVLRESCDHLTVAEARAILNGFGALTDQYKARVAAGDGEEAATA